MRDPESICIGLAKNRWQTGAKVDHTILEALYYFFGGLQWTCHGFPRFHDPLSEVWADGTSEAKDLLGVAWARTIFWWMRLSHTFTRIVCLFRKSFLDTENEHNITIFTVNVGCSGADGALVFGPRHMWTKAVTLEATVLTSHRRMMWRDLFKSTT